MTLTQLGNWLRLAHLARARLLLARLLAFFRVQSHVKRDLVEVDQTNSLVPSTPPRSLPNCRLSEVCS